MPLAHRGNKLGSGFAFPTLLPHLPAGCRDPEALAGSRAARGRGLGLPVAIPNTHVVNINARVRAPIFLRLDTPGQAQTPCIFTSYSDAGLAEGERSPPREAGVPSQNIRSPEDLVCLPPGASSQSPTTG